MKTFTPVKKSDVKDKSSILKSTWVFKIKRLSSMIIPNFYKSPLTQSHALSFQIVIDGSLSILKTHVLLRIEDLSFTSDFFTGVNVFILISPSNKKILIKEVKI